MAIFPGSAIPSGDVSYSISNSCRFDAARTTKLTRTPGSAGNQKTWTMSVWLKWSIQTQRYTQVMNFGGAGNEVTLYFHGETAGDPDDYSVQWSYWDGGSETEPYKLHTTQLFRDPAAWYHWVLVQDTTQAVAANRLKMYVNGEQITAFETATYPDQDLEPPAMSAVEHIIGTGGSGRYFEGYLADFYVIDGTALAPSDFGETNEDTNQWIPIDASGLTFGTNGFYQKYGDSSALGDDSSGNGNDFTVTNLVATDQVLDTPTNNWCTLNPLFGDDANAPVFSEGNLKCKTNTSGGGGVFASNLAVSSGKWYTEYYVEAESHSNLHQVGVTSEIYDLIIAAGPMYYGRTTTSWGLSWNSYWYNNDVTTQYDTSITYGVGDIVSTALDLTNSKLYWAVNGVWLNSADPTSGATGTGAISITSGLDDWVIGASVGSDASSKWVEGVMNYGQDSSFAGNKTAQGNQDSNEKGDFYYAPPTDYLALCTDNLSDPEIALPGENFNTILYDDGAGAKTGVGFQPDLVWLKSRGSAYEHEWTDALRGVTKALSCNSTNAESTDTTGLTAFGADGFTVGADTNYSDTTGVGMAAWNWKAGDVPTADNSAGAGAVPTTGSVKIDGANLESALAGTIAATRLSANTTAGFSIVTYTGTGVDATVAHGLSEAPDLIWVFRRTDAGYFKIISTTKAGLSFAKYFRTDTDDAVGTGNYWQDADPSSSLFSIEGADNSTNGSGKEFVAYCWHSVEGYSKITSYVGNGDADGPFIYTGFDPAWVMVKSLSSTRNFLLHDNKRNTYNPITKRLYVDLANAEETYSTPYDFVSNGLKTRSTVDSWNGSGEIHLVLAFAESPFKYSNAR